VLRKGDLPDGLGQPWFLTERAVLLECFPSLQHVKKILKSEDGKTLRIGVVDGGTEEDAVVEWQEDGSLKLAVPGDGSHLVAPFPEDRRPRVDLLLALPRPSNIASFLHIAAQMGVANIILSNAAKVQSDYFGSHLLRPPQKNMREALKAGLEQAGDVALPKVHVVRRLKPFLEDELEHLCPNTVRIVAHPQKEWLPPLPTVRQIELPPKSRLLVAVGPEAGWDDGFELDLLGKVALFAPQFSSRS
jgi:16S rRNA (uracil1498-N3)-methyltransferase